MDLEEYRRRYGGQDDAAPGWDAIDARLREVYGDQEPKHWGTAIKYMIGGKYPLDGISAYASDHGSVQHLHFCTYGYSSLYYDDESIGGAFSNFGFEMTFRLATSLPPQEDPIWVCDILENLACHVFKINQRIEPNQWMDTLGPIRDNSNLVGLAFCCDPELKSVDTPHGNVDFLQAFGITSKELEVLKSKEMTCEELLNQHRRTNPLLVTDFFKT